MMMLFRCLPWSLSKALICGHHGARSIAFILFCVAEARMTSLGVAQFITLHKQCYTLF